MALDCDALLSAVRAATGSVVSCRGFSCGAGRGKGFSIKRDNCDDVPVLLAVAFSVLRALAACVASCLPSCLITCFSIFFACFGVSSMRLSSAFTAVGVRGVPLANNDYAPSRSRGSAFRVVLTFSDSTFCMLLGTPVQSWKGTVHRT